MDLKKKVITLKAR